MKSFLAFTKKEFLEQIRTGRLFIFGILFCLFGIMNPAIAKITPWLMKMMASDLEESGIAVINSEVNAMTSWTQFYKNVPILLTIFLVMFSSILIAEYQKGTMIHIITKGMNRWKIIVSKTTVMFVLWTVGYFLCYGITYSYNAYFWDNSIAENVFFASFCFYIFGLWLITMIPLASSYFQSSIAVILSVGMVFIVSYVIGCFPAVSEYLPTYLMTAFNLLTSGDSITGYLMAMTISGILMIGNLFAAIVIFHRKNM